MEKRRVAVRLLPGAVALLAACAAAAQCTPPVRGTTLQSERYVLAYALPQISVSRHFSVDIGACAKPGNPAPEALKVDAQMPEHRHGMNYAPTVTQVGPGHWRAEGLLLHMPGRWELAFELRAAGKTDRLASRLDLSEGVVFSKDEIAKILLHGPWPPPARPDPTNRVSGKPEAIAFGEQLFFEPRLSGTGSVLCATCHAPFRRFQDSRARGFGLAEVERNTPTIVNVRFNRWFGWDGANDSLWAQSIRPLLDAREMRADAQHVSGTVRKLFKEPYEKAFARPLPSNDEELLVDVGKALAAFQETLVSRRSAFDDFRDALERNDTAAMERYPLAARRGLRIFEGKGSCSVCHFGPQFTNGEFADIGMSFFSRKGEVDPGRHGGIRKLKDSAYNLLGRYNDDASRSTATSTRHVEPQHRNFGEFRVPSLRNAALTAPYMHNGSLATLKDVVLYYSRLDEERLHADGDRILKPLHLTDAEVDDLVAFLESLTERQ